MFKKRYGYILFLFISIHSIKETISTNVNGNSLGNISSFLQQFLRPQPLQMKSVCTWQPGFELPQPNGEIEIACLRNRTMIARYVEAASRRIDQPMSVQKFFGLQVKANAYLARDATVAVCRLSCTRGKPYKRHRPLPPFGVLEPNAVNIGCDDVENMQCRGFCPVSTVQVPNGDVDCTDGLFAGSLCTLQCHRGYRPRGATKKLCAHQTWFPQSPFACDREVSCEVLPPVENGVLNCTRGNNLFSSCRFTCNDGYDPIGPLEQWCMPASNATASWTVIRQRSSSSSSAVERNMLCIDSSEKESSSSKRTSTGNGAVILKRYDTRKCPVIVPLEQRVPCRKCKNKFICLGRNYCWDEWTSNLTHRCYKPGKRRTIPMIATTTPQPSQQNYNLGGGPNGYRRSNFPPNCICTSTRPVLRTCYARSASRASPPAVTPSGTQILAQPSVNARLKSLPLVEQRIYMGDNALVSDWPWQAILQFNGYLCGGTLISNRHIITAAHCFRPFNASVIANGMVFLGVTNISNPILGTTQSRRARKVVRHQNFSTSSDLHSRNDLAIIELDVPAYVDGSYVKTLCLPRNRSPRISDECYVTGFGRLSGDGPVPNVLQQACVPLVSRAKCERSYGNYLVPYEHLCAGGGRNAADTCQGDSGGPLVCRRPGSGRCGWYLAGVTSFGQSPCDREFPSVYMNVFHYQYWIFKTIRRMERQTST